MSTSFSKSLHVEFGPSAIRMTPDWDPWAHSAADKPALNLANPFGGGARGPRTPKRTVRESRCGAAGDSSDSWVGRAFKGIPTCGRYRSVRRERLLCEISGNRLMHPGLAGFPNYLTLHPMLGGLRISQADLLRRSLIGVAGC